MISELVQKIAADSGMNEEDVMRKIEDKRLEMSGLISEEGAAYMLAKEMGIVVTRKDERLNIASILPGMQNVEIVGKITRILPVREFSSDKAKGKVMNFFVADASGSVRMSLWNDEIDKFSLQENDVVQIRGFAKANNMGLPELRLGRYGSITLSEEIISTVAKKEQHAERSEIISIQESRPYEIRAAIMQVFETNIFYEICPQCGARVKADESLNFSCVAHGAVEPDYNILISGVLDDGTENIRAVFFGEAAESFVGLKKKEAKKLHDIKGAQALIAKMPLGVEMLFIGRTKRNNIFNRLEFIVNDVKKIDVLKEIEMLKGE